MEATEQLKDANTVVELRPEQISRYEGQPRRLFCAFGEDDFSDEEEVIKRLARSIKKLGQLHPVTVMCSDNGTPYQLIDGERRWRAITVLNEWRSHEQLEPLCVRAIAENVPLEQQFERSVASNAGRENLLPIEEVWAIARLVLKYKKTPDEIMSIFSKSRSWADQRCKIIQLPADVIDLMHPKHDREQLTVGTLVNLARVAENDIEAGRSLASDVRGMSANHAALHIKANRPEASHPQRGRKPASGDEQFAQAMRQISAKVGIWAQMPSDVFAKRFANCNSREVAEVRRIMESIDVQFEELFTRIKNIEEFA